MINQSSGTLEQSEADRNKEKDESMKSIDTAKEGLAAVKEAISILRKFYSASSDATAPDASVAASSAIYQDTAFSTQVAYKGKQTSQIGIIGLLQNIESDFTRTISMTKEQEEN